MRCSQLAKYSAARTDSGTSDCLQAILLRVGLGHVAQGTRLRRIRTLVQTVCICARYGFPKYTHQRRGRFGTRVCENFPFKEEQTNKFRISAIEPLGKPREYLVALASA